jgi:hypothetical protein
VHLVPVKTIMRRFKSNRASLFGHATFLRNWRITPWQHNTSINRNKFLPRMCDPSLFSRLPGIQFPVSMILSDYYSIVLYHSCCKDWKHVAYMQRIENWNHVTVRRLENVMYSELSCEILKTGCSIWDVSFFCLVQFLCKI